MSHETENKLPTKLWGGGRSPFNVEYGKLMMWIFLLSDAFTFSALLIAYGSTRSSFPAAEHHASIPFGSKIEVEDLHQYFTPSTPGAELAPGVQPHWPSPDLVFNHFPFLHGHHLPLLFVSLMTFILIFSSVTMVLAVEAGHRNEKKEVAKYMYWTIAGGIAFLSCQAWEWTQFISAGANLKSNPFGPVAFADLFFIVTGFHGFHVLSGVVLNIVITSNVLKGTYEKRGHYDMVEKVGLYWHFVDLVWVFVFTFYYLI
ncbi:MAG: cytochrome c oxidase subunit 3 [Bacteroidetes bacterium]|nr:cytochrome c oxidase subunit 3 [Bacteroidota bacterium]